MLARTKLAGLRILGDVASLPLRLLRKTERGQALQKLTDSMVSEIDVPNGSLRFLVTTPLLQWRANSVLSKEPDTIQWIDRFEPGDIFWDVGANVGVFSLYAACCRGVRVLAFEPSADNYMVLCRNIELNHLARCIVPYCIALAGSTGLGILNLSSQEMGAALHQFGEEGEISRYWDGCGRSCTQGMVGFSIDDFISQFAPPFPTRLKIDVDGLEWPILQGAERTICDPRLKSLMAELPVTHEAERDRAIAWLSERGFDLVMRGEPQPSGDNSAANHFFAKRDCKP